MRSVINGPPPLKGTWSISISAEPTNSTPKRWGGLPAPGLPKAALEGLALAHWTSSCKFLTFNAFETASPYRISVARVIGARSLVGSNCSLGRMIGSMAAALTPANNSTVPSGGDARRAFVATRPAAPGLFS